MPRLMLMPCADRQGDSGVFVIGMQVRPYNWRMRRAREASGMTQAALAELADCSVACVQVLETFRESPTVSRDTVDRVASILSLTPEQVCPSWFQARIIREVLAGELPVRITEADAAEPDMLQGIVQAEMKQALRVAMSTLPPRVQKVLGLRFGFEDGHIYTLEEVGRHLGITRERIRELESWSLKRLRRPHIVEELR